ncbi:unnamed protein product [Sympodiomycopsis kandeliae]
MMTKFSLLSSLLLVATSSMLSASAAPTSTSGQIKCTASYLGAGKGGAGLILDGSGPNDDTSSQAGNGKESLVGRSNRFSTQNGLNEQSDLVVDSQTLDTFRFYECDSTSLGVKSNDGSNRNGLLVLQHGNVDDGLLTGDGQCIQTSTAPPEEDHSQASFVVAPCDLNDASDFQAKQFFTVNNGKLIWQFRGNTEFPNFLDGKNLEKGDAVTVRQGVSSNPYNGFIFVDTD